MTRQLLKYLSGGQEHYVFFFFFANVHFQECDLISTNEIQALNCVL